MIWWLILACTSGVSDDSGGVPPFCESIEDGDSYVISDGGGSSTSGLVQGRLISDETDDLHDTSLIGYLDYSLENSDVGGSPTLDQTEMNGDFSNTLGEGTWVIKASGQRLIYDCSAEFEFAVVAGKTTELCVDLQCE
ncbi:MAG: hypothetical protein QGG40_13425 [Myxococcota bacterium]|nr:hypothetical protein [Myxococcota bacterium]